MSRIWKGWLCAGLALSLTASFVPAQASEVVKLARLVVSGKRTMAEPPRTTPAEPRPASPQAHGGGSNEAGTAPAPPRGVS